MTPDELEQKLSEGERLSQEIGSLLARAEKISQMNPFVMLFFERRYRKLIKEADEKMRQVDCILVELIPYVFPVN